MAKRIEFDTLFMEKLQNADQPELQRIADNSALALRLRFQNAAVEAPRKRGRPAGSANKPKPAEVTNAQ